MGPQSVREYVASLQPRYRIASRADKTRLLDEFCHVTGRHRKAAIRRLRQPPRPSGARGGRPPRYGPALVELLTRVWEASDYLCGKRLAPFLEPLVDALERHHELEVPSALRPLLLGISPATIDRLVRAQRRPHPHRLVTSGRASSALAAQVPIRTFGEWRDVRPGALQADLVAHCGASTDGFYLTSLVAVDVATGWTECQAVWGKGYQRVKQAVHWVHTRLPMPVHAFHTDNGGEFLNHLLVPWCRQSRIHFTRGRPWRKNDQAYAEQKNWAVVRRLIGYDRYSSPAALEALRAFYAVLRLYWNFFQPLRKLTTKIRHGARVTKRYDRAQTPYQRLLASGIRLETQRETLDLVYRELNPVALRAQMHQHLQRLWQLADPPEAASTGKLGSPSVTGVLRHRPHLR